MSDQLPGLERELKVRRHLSAPAVQCRESGRLVKGMLDLNTGKGTRIFRLRDTESTCADLRFTRYLVAGVQGSDWSTSWFRQTYPAIADFCTCLAVCKRSPSS